MGSKKMLFAKKAATQIIKKIAYQKYKTQN